MTAKRPKRTTVKLSKKPSKDLLPRYEPSPTELAVLADCLAWRQQTPPVPWVNVEGDRFSYKTSFEHPDQALAEVMLAKAFGTPDPTLARGLCNQLANASRSGELITANELNYMISLVRGVGPRDPTEGMLAAQMAAIHNAAMVAARRLNHVETIEQQNSVSNMLNKLARTFAIQIEALKRYRSNGEQTIKVQHVNVNDGAQAIFGNVTTRADGGPAKNEGQSHEPSLAPTSGTPLLGDLEANRSPVSSTRGTREEGVPVPRSKSRCARRHC